MCVYTLCAFSLKMTLERGCSLTRTVASTATECLPLVRQRGKWLFTWKIFLTEIEQKKNKILAGLEILTPTDQVQGS